jgi:hypothetical protein
MNAGWPVFWALIVCFSPLLSIAVAVIVFWKWI